MKFDVAMCSNEIEIRTNLRQTGIGMKSYGNFTCFFLKESGKRKRPRLE